MGVFDFFFQTNKDILTDDGLNVIYDRRQQLRGLLKFKFYKKKGLLDGEFIEYQAGDNKQCIFIKGQFKNNLMHGEWSEWGQNPEPGCVEIWENGHLKSIEFLYENFLRIPFQKTKGKFTGENINDEKLIKNFGKIIKYSYIVDSLRLSGLNIQKITVSTEIKPL
tara:strand:- start:518 stop:1012 length:495 start_codon:yes stop_codon:yes gene_type:complete